VDNISVKNNLSRLADIWQGSLVAKQSFRPLISTSTPQNMTGVEDWSEERAGNGGLDHPLLGPRLAGQNVQATAAASFDGTQYAMVDQFQLIM
jgi:hypothetical protein